ncbi:MAG: hypothetical protein PHI71_05795 [Acidiphilium sp.]|nr:hypothetical protein [Acidiphilium sp.]
MVERTSNLSTDLSAQITEIPPDLLGIVRNGFAIASNLPIDVQSKVVNLVVQKMQRLGGNLDTDAIVQATGLDRREASRLNVALITTLRLLTESLASPAEFVEVGIGKLFHADDSVVAQFVATVVADQRTELQKTFAREHLANAVLPSLTSFDVAVDLRFKFSGPEIDDTVAVAVAHIGTDTQFQQIWLQLTKTDVESIIEKLSVALKQLYAAEAFGRPTSRTTEQ